MMQSPPGGAVRRTLSIRPSAIAIAFVTTLLLPISVIAAPPLPSPLTVDEAVRTALALHPLVGQADADADAAFAREAQTRTVLYPQVGASVGWNRAQTYSGSAGRTTTATNEAIQGTVSQLVTDFGRTRDIVGQASSLTGAAKETGKATRLDVAYAVRLAYVDVQYADRLVVVRGEAVRQRESLHTQAKASVEAGLRARIDAARAEANLYQAKADLSRAISDARLTRLRLLNRMGVDAPAADLKLADALGGTEPTGDAASWSAEALKIRPDLAAVRAKETAARLNLAVAKDGILPSIVATGGYGLNGPDTPDHENWAIGILATVPVWNGGIVKRKTDEAEANLRSTFFAVKDAERRVRLEVEGAALSVRESRERIEARKKELSASEENLALATGRYEVGAGDIIEMIDAQAQLVGAQSSLANAQADHDLAVAALLRAVGRTP